VKKTLFLTLEQKKKREKICEHWLVTRMDFTKVVYSDEKKFNLDGPDNWKSYQKQNQPGKRKKRQAGGGGIMCFGLIFSSGILCVKKITGKVTASSYQSLLSSFAVPLMFDLMGDDFLFQQDNCSVHVARSTLDFLEE